MDLQHAQHLVSQLGVELGGDSQTYQMDANGEAHLIFEDNIGVMIKHEATVLVLACTLAEDVSDNDPGMFATLMAYQYLGLRTVGAVLSCNPESDTLVLSRMLFGEPTAAALSAELTLLLQTGTAVRDEIQPILDGVFDDVGDDAADRPEPFHPGMLN